jgi:hypothetical protein
MRSSTRWQHLALVTIAAGAAAMASCACRADAPAKAMTPKQISAKVTASVAALRAYGCSIECVSRGFMTPETRTSARQWWQKPDLIRAEFEDFAYRHKEIHAVKGSTLFRFLPEEGKLIEVPGYREWVRKAGPDFVWPNANFHHSVIHSMADLLAAMVKSGAGDTRVAAEGDDTLTVEGNWPKGFSFMGSEPAPPQEPEGKVTLKITVDRHSWLPTEVRASAESQKVVLSVSRLRVDKPQPESFFEPGVGTAKERIVRRILRAEDLWDALSSANLLKEVTLEKAIEVVGFEVPRPGDWGEPIRVDIGLSGSVEPERDRSGVGLLYRVHGAVVYLTERPEEFAGLWYGGSSIHGKTMQVDGAQIVVDERVARAGWRFPAQCAWCGSKSGLRFEVCSDDMSATELLQLVEPFIKQTASGEQAGGSPEVGSGP